MISKSLPRLSVTWLRKQVKGAGQDRHGEIAPT